MGRIPGKTIVIINCGCTDNINLFQHENHFTDFVGMEVLYWTLLEVTNKKQFLELEQHGLKVFIPENSLPVGTRACTLTIGVSISGKFKFPDSRNVVSAIYAFHLSDEVRLVKPLKIEMQHCAKVSSPESILVARASCKDESFPYKFEVLSGKMVTLHQDSCMDKQFVGLDLQYFSLYSILSEEPKLYTAILFYQEKRDAIDICITITRKLGLCISVS